MTTPRPIAMLIAALGGEGGGVLTDWIVAAADAQGFPVQSTSIPGVAQRTGATTYYIEMMPVTLAALGGKRPILALTPSAGDVDVVLASELMEGARAIGNGHVTPDRTALVASTHRSYAIAERMAMGDGRYDIGRLTKAIETHAKQHLLFDMATIAKDSGAMINAVMLGALAAANVLPIPIEAFEQAIRHDGKAVDANLRGFRAGHAAATRAAASPTRDGKRRKPATPTVAALEAEANAIIPASAREIAIEGLRRTAAYQDTTYAALYLERLKRILAADARADAGGRLVRETARQLAVRMTFEDVVRVAEAKIAPERFVRIRRELGLKDGEPYRIVEFLKPGLDEMCQVLPTRLAQRILALGRAPRLAPALGHGDRDHLAHRLSALLDAGEAAALPPARPSLRAGAGCDHAMARPDRRGRPAVRRRRGRNRRMRAPDQRLRRHLAARHDELCDDRDAGDPPAAGRRPPAQPGR